jgi:hypothetical protein
MTAIQRTVLKHPGSAYFIVAFFALCATVIVRSWLQALVYLVPLAGAIYVARTATIIDDEGITARVVFGSQQVRWEELRGLRLMDSGAVYVVDTGGTQLRLPCVRNTKLEPLIAASDGRIPNPATASAPSPATAEVDPVEPDDTAVEPAAGPPAAAEPAAAEPTSVADEPTPVAPADAERPS